MKKQIIILIIFLIVNLKTQDIAENRCKNRCLDCQKTVYNLKFQRKLDCNKSYCKTTVIIDFIK